MTFILNYNVSSRYERRPQLKLGVSTPEKGESYKFGSVIKYRGTFYRQAAKLIMYHGTASGENDEILRRILKEGLNPEPPQRVFTEDKEDTHRREMQTLGGVYFSAYPHDVSKFSLMARDTLGGDCVAVIAQIETRTPSVTIDEDDLFSFSKKYIDSYYHDVFNMVDAGSWSILQLLEENKLAWDDVAEHFIKNELLVKWEISEQEAQRLMTPIAEVMRLQTEYFLAKEYERKNLSFGTGSIFEQLGLEKDANKVLGELRAAVKIALQKIQVAANPPTSDDKWQKQFQREHHKIRITEPVTYRGANRILAVLRWSTELDRPPYYVMGQVVYEASDARPYIMNLIKKLGELKSQYMLWTTTGGEALYDVVKEKAASTIRYRGAIYVEL